MAGSPNQDPPPSIWLPAAGVLACCLIGCAVAAPLLRQPGRAGTATDVVSAVAAAAGLALLALLWRGRRSATAVSGLLAGARLQVRHQAEQFAEQAGQLAEREADLDRVRGREQELAEDRDALRGRLEESLDARQALVARERAARQALEQMVTVRFPAAFEGGPGEAAEPPQDLDAEMAALLDRLAAEATRAGDRQESMRAAVVALSRRVQAAAHRIQEEATLIADRHPGNPGVLDVSMRVDHAAAQQARHAQSMAVLCGEWPGQQWPQPLPLADVVRAAAGRIIAFPRVEVAGDPDIAASAPVVEPLIHLIAELLANATQSSPPSTAVPVTIRAVQRGAVIEVNDCGVGLDDYRLEQARDVASGTRPVGIEQLGEFPRTGLAVVGQYVRRHGFRVDVGESVYGGVRAIVGVPADLVQTVAPAEAETAGSPPAAQPAAVPAALAEDGDAQPDATAAGGPGLPRRRSPRHAPPVAATSAPQPDSAPQPGTGPEAGSSDDQPTPERAGAWMGAFLTGDAAAGTGRDAAGQAVAQGDSAGQEIG